MIFVGLLIAAVAAYLFRPTERKRSRNWTRYHCGQHQTPEPQRESTKTKSFRESEYAEMDALRAYPMMNTETPIERNRCTSPQYHPHLHRLRHRYRLRSPNHYVAPVPAPPPPAGPDWYCVCYHEKCVAAYAGALQTILQRVLQSTE